ncbi:MAG: hypothetical protein ACO3FN_12825, partial [Vulcanococcus sp.]
CAALLIRSHGAISAGLWLSLGWGHEGPHGEEEESEGSGCNGARGRPRDGWQMATQTQGQHDKV